MSSPDARYPPPTAEIFASPPITVVLAILLVVFFFVGFFSIYFCRCFMDNVTTTWNLRRTPSGNIIRTPAVAVGLDSSIIESFPTFVYSSVKDYRKEKYGLECAICLVEFEDDSLLRLLTVCNHVYHQECIDLWLKSHKTCPVCRRNLDSEPNDELEKPAPNSDPNSMHGEMNNHGSTDQLLEGSVHIDIKEEEGEESGGAARASLPSHERPLASRSKRQQSKREKKVERFSRSHTTGHSIIRTKLEVPEDKYTLKLPEHVKAKLIRHAQSCTTFDDLSIHKVSGSKSFAEVSAGADCENINKL